MFGYGEENWEMLDPVHALHVSVAPVILTTDGDQLQVLMKNNFDGPSKGEFVLPHSVLPQDQVIEETAAELMDRHDLGGVKLEQASTFSFPRIDPRSRVMTVGLLGAVPAGRLEWARHRNDTALVDIKMEGSTAMLSLGGVPVSAGFVHEEVVGAAVSKLRRSIEYSLIPFSFLGEHFTYPELVEVHEAVLGEKLVAQWVRRKLAKRIFEGDLMIVGTGQKCSDGPGRPAELFSLIRCGPEERRRARAVAARKRKAAKLWA